MELSELIKTIEEDYIKDPFKGLPEDVFLFISRITPLVNVDLLIKNEKEQTLLTWREDGFFEPGWHVPGGIIRYKEPINKRIGETAKTELGALVMFDESPLAINQIILPGQRNRAHFISLLYKCELIGEPDEKLRYRGGRPKHGQWAWHDRCPKNLLKVHEIYRKFI